MKVLDFGLAKLTEPVESDETPTTETLEPNTEEGTIVGTVAYMSLSGLVCVTCNALWDTPDDSFEAHVIALAKAEPVIDQYEAVQHKPESTGDDT